MRASFLPLVVLLASVGAVDGANACFDDKCESGSNTLNLYGCGLTDDDIPDLEGCLDVVGRDGIETLILASNELATLPEDVFQGLGSLTRLLLNGNKLSVVTSGLFDGLGQLQYLYLYSNVFTTLPAGIFEGLYSLKYLTLSKNALTALPPGVFDGLEALSSLYLTDNELTTLPDGLFNDLASLNKLFLTSNPGLQCIPANAASDVRTDDITFGECECTSAALCDKLDCVPGSSGYTCVYHTATAGMAMD